MMAKEAAETELVNLRALYETQQAESHSKVQVSVSRV